MFNEATGCGVGDGFGWIGKVCDGGSRCALAVVAKFVKSAIEDAIIEIT